MYDLSKCILVTNNDRAAEKWKNSVGEVILLDTYGEVLKKARDLIHTKHKLLTHPQASSLKPNQTPYRTILLYEAVDGDNTRDVCLIEDALETFEKWNRIHKVPEYDEAVAYDYKTIDLSMIENVIPRL
ncbi:MAG: GrdX family protein [Clostridium sp.]|nr:GrdX family protein [Clostridium sp.]